MKHLSGQPCKLTILVRACRRQSLHRPLARAQQEQPRTSRSQSRRQKPDLFADWHSTALFKYSKGFSIPVNLSWLITKKYITIHDTPTNYKTITYGCCKKNTTQHFWTLNQWYFAAVKPTSLWGLPLFISQQTIVIKDARIFAVYKKTQRQCLLVEQSVEDGQSKMPIEQLSYVFGLSSILINIQANKRTLVQLSIHTTYPTIHPL